jgi:transposase
VGSHDRAVKAEIDQTKCKKQNGGRDHRMDKEQLRAAKVQFIATLQESHSWKKAATAAGLQISQSNAYRLMNAVRLCGETALSDGRHGHPSKLRGAARAFLEERCRQTSQTPSSTIQVELQVSSDLINGAFPTYNLPMVGPRRASRRFLMKISAT